MDNHTGQHLWRRYTIPAPGEPGSETWPKDIPDAWNEILVLLLVQALVAIIGYTACSFLIDRYGRRPVLFLYYFVGAFFHLWFAYAAGIWLYVAIGLVGWANPDPEPVVHRAIESIGATQTGKLICLFSADRTFRHVALP